MNMLVIDRDVLGTAGVFQHVLVPVLPAGGEGPSTSGPAGVDASEGVVESKPPEVREDPLIGEPAVTVVLEGGAGTGGAETRQDSTTAEPPTVGAEASSRTQGAFEFGLGVRMEMATTPQGLELAMELPGVQERDIQIEARSGMLVVLGEVRRDSERPDKTYRMSDRSYGQFSRSIDLPKGVRPDQIKASLDCGLLSIFIPNPVSPTSTKIHIQSALTYLTVDNDVLEFAIAAPGVEEDDLDIEVAGGMLTIWGRPGRLPSGDTGLPARQGKDPTIFRAIELPVDVRADQITATLARGVLRVMIPIRSSQDPQRVRVQAA